MAWHGGEEWIPAEEAAVSDFTRTQDFQDACRAFLAKRKPVFRGR